MLTETSRHREVIHQEILTQKLIENVKDDLEMVSLMSVLSSKDLPDMSIQQLMIGKHFGQKYVQIQTQILCDWSWMKMKTTTITMIMIMITTIIKEMEKFEMTGMINQIDEDAGREGEQFQVMVQEMDRIMMIGLKGYNAKFRDNSQDNSKYNAIDEIRPYLQFKQLQEHLFICQTLEQLKIKLFVE
ncbi:MAG: hypothetical protein EZS28_004297 [Streblomastix strix]|uniref:Uncharacterized protein n=1 Tax=Streblomastix strix TaxID=222440 RepID=A0A5J4X126_9EUKA|nr:MAG: hypothetical protein EZS28_004297 [Streblomastix strix]